jgi:ceramide glucosyltransferase
MSWLALAISLVAFFGCIYLVVAAALVRRFARDPSPPSALSGSPGVTVLKPLHGDEPGLAENLLSFCDQAYPRFQVVFGVRDGADPAAEVARRIVAARPDADLALVVDGRVTGANYKIANLENMMRMARYEVIVVADSDMRVTPDYLAAVTGPLADPAVGLVTCLYRGRPVGTIWARLGSLFINHGFLPSAVVNERLRPSEACFGATMALRRAVLEEIGGFAGLRDQLADDYALGRAVRDSGRRLVLSLHLVDTIVGDSSLAGLARHELRWLRTIRLLAPWGFAGSIVTHPLALALLAWGAAGFSLPFSIVPALALICRLATVRVVDRALGLAPGPTWLIPVRDVLSFVLFVASFCGRKIAWRDRTFRLQPDGRLVADGESPA